MKVKVHVWWEQYIECGKPTLFVSSYRPQINTPGIQEMEVELDIPPPPTWAERKAAEKENELKVLADEIEAMQKNIAHCRSRRNELLDAYEQTDRGITEE
jgi:hypothetical protein